MLITRRELTAAVVAAAGLAQAQQTPAAAPADDLQAARERIKANGEAMARVKVPMATEPAFQFKA